MWLGIVGSEAAKFTREGEIRAKAVIAHMLSSPDITGLVSGGCHLGGIDIWSEEIAIELGKGIKIFKPKALHWDAYRSRNIQIARHSDKVTCITVDCYPREYNGMKFATCYHCQTNTHIKSGGCWTTKCANNFGKDTELIVIRNY